MQMVMRVSALALAILLSFASVAAQAQQRLIVGVTDLGVAARELPAQAAAVRGIIGISGAIAVTGDPDRLRHLPFVRYVEDDPPDAVSIDGEVLEYGVHQINAEAIWGGASNATALISGQGGAGVKVAVIDTGIDCGHQDLAGGCVYGANFANGSQPFDDNGHGTHIGGIIAARQNAVGVIGVAPEATVYAVKALNSTGTGSWSSVAMGIDWAVSHGMHIINMSLGATVGSQAVADAVARAEAAGVLVVASAGNYGCCNTVGYPAAYDGVLAVAAVDSNQMRASFSSTGPQVDIAAPGVGIRSSVPTGSCSLCDPSGYAWLSGTSMAAPHVAGVGALLRSRGWSAMEAASLMTTTAVDLGAPGFDPEYGYGRVDALAATGGAPPAPPPPPPPADTVAPLVAVTSPANGSTIAKRANVTIQATASDDVGVSRVEFFVNGSLRCTDTAAPFSCGWKAPNSGGKTHVIAVKAWDAAGNSGQAAVSVTIR
jgi:subtilisin family serine protease